MAGAGDGSGYAIINLRAVTINANETLYEPLALWGGR